MKTLGLKCLRALLLGVAAFFGPLAANAVPVFPGAIGFGTDTPAGRGGIVYRVTNLNDSGPGSLRYGIEHSSMRQPRVIIFNVSGVIELQSDLVIRDDSFGAYSHLTIAGQTAPYPGITLKNYGISIRSHDILIQHLAIRPGNHVFSGTQLDNRDAIKIETPAGVTVYNVVLDHLSCSWSVDELVSLWGQNGQINNVTLLNCIFADPIMNGEPDSSGHSRLRTHSEGTHGFGPLVGPNTSNVSIIRNIMAFIYGRNPAISSTSAGAQIVNNLIYRPGPWSNNVIRFNTMSTSPRTASVIGNAIFRHPLPFTMDITAMPAPPAAQQLITTATNHTQFYSTGIYIFDDVSTSASFYLDDNRLFNPQTSTWLLNDAILRDRSTTPVTRRTSDYYDDSGGTTWTPWASADVTDNLLARAGKFPANRDAIDAALIQKIENRNQPQPAGGTFLERLSDLGTDPWAPVDAQNTRALDLPDSPDTVNLDGYTNLERWLHSLAADVEGTGGGSGPANLGISTFDTFSDGNDNGWTWHGAVNWTVTSGAYRQSDLSGGARAMLEGTNWEDQVVEARVTPVSFDGTSRFAAVYARYADINNSYYVALRNGVGTGNLGQVELKKIVNGTASNLATAQNFPVTVGTPYKVRLVVSGTSVSAVVTNLSNNTTATFSPVTDTSLASGRAAIGTYRASADFDNVFASPVTSSVPHVMDDFDDGNANGWDTTWTGMGGSWSVVTDGSPGLRQASSAASVGARAMAPDTTNLPNANQSIQADVKPLTFTGNSWVGVFARFASPTETYYLLLRNNGDLELKKLTSSGQVSFAVKSMPSSFNLNAWHTLRLVATGTSTVSLQAYVDGVLELTATDSSSPIVNANKAGVGTFSASAQFDDIVITSP
jgi:hypothetical protein